MATNEFIVRKGLIVNGSGSTVLDIQGSQGQLFSVTDDLTGTLFSVNDISGIPILSVDSDDTVTMGTFGENTLVVSGSRVGIGSANTTSRKLRISGGSEVPLLLDATQDYLLGFARAGSEEWWIRATTGGDLIVHENGVGDKVTFQAGGDVGIGTTSPSSLLHLSNASSPALTIQDTTNNVIFKAYAQDANAFVGTTSTHNLNIGTANTAAININNSQNVTVNNQLYVNDYARIDALRVGTTSTDPGDGNLYVEGTSTLGAVAIHSSNYIKVGIGQGMRMYNQDNDNHGIFSQNSGGGGDDDIRINSYGAIYLNLDSNNNNGSGADFSIARHGGTGTLSDYLFKLDGESGRVGIGTTSPNDKLHVVGNLFIEDSSPEITLETGATHYNWQIAAQENVDAGLEFSVGSQDADASNDTFSPLMTIKNTGNVGIGTTSPSYKLDVGDGTVSTVIRIHAGVNGSASLRLKNDAQDWDVNTQTTDTFAIYNQTSGTQPFSILTNGNVGIGTASPSHMLDITTSRSGNGQGSTIRINRPDNSSYENAINWATNGTNKWFLGSDNDSTENFYLYNWAAGAFALTVQGSNNNVGIGTTSPGEALTVGDGSADTSIAIKKSDNNVSDHLQFFNGTTRVGEIGAEDNTWLRINQETANNIYTPRYIRADGGFFVDNTTFGINGSGRLLSNSLSGTYSNSIGFSGGIDVYGASPAIKARGSDSEVILQSTNESAGNPNQFYIQHNFGNVDIGNSRGNITFNNGNITITNDLFVDDYARIDALRIGTTSTDPGDGNLYVEGNSQHVGTVGYTSFNSGFGGDGWRIDQNANAEFENLTVRGTFSVYELLAQQIRATNGSLLVATSGKVDSSTGTTSGTIFFDTGSSYGHGFLDDDILLAQRLDPSGTSLKRTFVRVDSRLNAGSLSYTKLNGDNVEAGQEFVRIGNTTDTDRQGHIYLTADDSNAPYIGVRDGVSAYTDFTSATGSVEKVRVGRLDGVTSTTFSTLSGYGLWASGSVYLEGGINATFGKIADLTITTSKIHTGAGNHNNADTGFYIDNNSNFSLGNKFSWNGSALTIDGNITATTGTIGGFTIGSNTLSTTNFTIGDSTQTYAIAAGSSNQFTVTHAGVLTATGAAISGNITATSGTIGGWTAATTLSATNILLDPATPKITLGAKASLTDANTGAYIGTDGLALGASSVFKVTDAGVLTATSATITGAITATSGTFTGTVNANAGNFTSTVNIGNGATTGTLAVGTATNKITIVGTNADTTTKIHSGTGTYNNTNTGFYMDASGRFSLKDKLTWDGTTLTVNGGGTFSGDISAASGTFTGDLSGANISGGTIDIGGADATSFHVDSDGQIWSGNAAYSNAPFRVSSGGAIRAESGLVGGWTLGASSLTGGSGATTIGLIPGTGIHLGNAAFGSSPFRVTNAGALTATNATISGNITATSGTIGGWTVGSTLSATNILLDPATPRITLGAKTSLTDGNTGAYIGTDGLALGASSVFKVTDAGVLTATSATITGAITATSITATTAGNIAGWTVGSDTLSKSGLSLSTAANNIGLKYVVSSKNKIQIGDFATASKTETNLGTTTYYSENETVNGVLSLSTATLNSSGNVQGDAISFSSGIAQGYFRIAADLGGKTLEDGESFNIKCSALQPNLSSRTSDTSEAPEFTVRIFDSTGTLVTETKGPTSSIYDLFPRTHNFNLTYTNTTGAQKSGVYAEVKIKAYDIDGSAINNLDIEDIVVYKATPKVNITDQQALFYNSPTNYFEWTPNGILIVGSTLTPDAITTGLFTANEASTFNQNTTFNSTVVMSDLDNKGSEATAVVIDTNNVIGTRELGANAFTSTTIGTTTNSLTVSTGLDLNSGTTFNGSVAKTITLDLTEVTANSATSNAVLTNDGDGTLTAETNLTYGGTDLTNAGGGYIVDRGATNILLFKGLDSNNDGIQLGVNTGGDPYFAPIENGTTQFSQEFLWDTSADTWVIEDGLQVDGVFEIDPNGAYLYMNTDGNSRNLIRFDRSSTQNWEFRLGSTGTLELNDIGASRTFEMDCIITKRSGTFKIKHPDPAKNETHDLYHSFVESPTAGDNIYRWQVEVVNGTAVVELPDYYKYLNENTQVWVSADEHLGYGFGKINEEETRLTIQTNSDGIYNVLCIGTRKDKDAVEAWTGCERLQSESSSNP